jgi:hypothetical protein
MTYRKGGTGEGMMSKGKWNGFVKVTLPNGSFENRTYKKGQRVLLVADSSDEESAQPRRKRSEIARAAPGLRSRR